MTSTEPKPRMPVRQPQMTLAFLKTRLAHPEWFATPPSAALFLLRVRLKDPDLHAEATNLYASRRRLHRGMG